MKSRIFLPILCLVTLAALIAIAACHRNALSVEQVESGLEEFNHAGHIYLGRPYYGLLHAEHCPCKASKAEATAYVPTFNKPRPIIMTTNRFGDWEVVEETW